MVNAVMSAPIAKSHQSPDWAGRISVVLVDDSAVAMTALVRWLHNHLPLQITGQAEDGLHGFELVSRLQPDLVISDLQMPGLDGFELVERLRRNFPRMRLILVSFDESPTLRSSSLRHGADAFIPKSRLPEELPGLLTRLFPQVTEVAPSLTLEPQL